MTMTLFLLLAAALGTAYVYMRREGSPYEPSMFDYLGEESSEPSQHRRAA